MEKAIVFLVCVMIAAIVQTCISEVIGSNTTLPVSKDNNTCPENETFKPCEQCHKSCKVPTPVCNRTCRKGCFCNEGLLRDKDGKCVSFEKCSRSDQKTNISLNTTSTLMPYEISCGPHQEYHGCQRCESTCSDLRPSCEGGCRAGCFCQEGFVKAPSGQCVELKDCPRAEMSQGVNELTVEECLPDEVFVACGWCERTCSAPNPRCPEQACTRGCLCRPPLLRHSSGHCVEESDCTPQKCSDPDEEFGCRYGCEATCAYRACIRPRRCRRGCHCKLGLFRNSARKCVLPQQCLTDLNNTLFTL